MKDVRTMPTYRVLLHIEGSDRFHINADDQDAANELAEELVNASSWESERQDLQYTVVGVDLVSP
jgi:hypothetical protein